MLKTEADVIAQRFKDRACIAYGSLSDLHDGGQWDRWPVTAAALASKLRDAMGLPSQSQGGPDDREVFAAARRFVQNHGGETYWKERKEKLLAEIGSQMWREMMVDATQ